MFRDPKPEAVVRSIAQSHEDKFNGDHGGWLSLTSEEFKDKSERTTLKGSFVNAVIEAAEEYDLIILNRQGFFDVVKVCPPGYGRRLKARFGPGRIRSAM
jgi:hypothetical protein